MVGPQLKGPIDWSQLVNLIDESNKSTKNINGKNMSMLIGPTGAGKTTTIHFLNGAKLKQTADKIMLEKSPPPHFAQFIIGADQKSQTRFISAATSTMEGRKEQILVDTPGFSDTEGITMDLANMVSISSALKKCANAFLILVIPHNYLKVDRGSLFRKLLHLVHSLFKSTNDINKDAIQIFFTKVPKGVDIFEIKEEILEIKNVESQGNTEAVMEMLDFILDCIENDEGIYLIDPTKANAKAIRGKFGKGIDGKKFNFPVAGDTMSVVASNLREIEQSVTSMLNKSSINLLSSILDGFNYLSEYIPKVKASYSTCCGNLETFVQKESNKLIPMFSKSIFAKETLAQQLFEELGNLHEILRLMEEGNIYKHLSNTVLNAKQFADAIIKACSDFVHSIEQQTEKKLKEYESLKENLTLVVRALKFIKIDHLSKRMDEFIISKTSTVQKQLLSVKIDFQNLEDVAKMLENLRSSSTNKTNVSEVVIKSIQSLCQGFESDLKKVQNSFEAQPSSLEEIELPTTGKKRGANNTHDKENAPPANKKRPVGDDENPFLNISESYKTPASQKKQDTPEAFQTINALKEKMQLFQRIIEHKVISTFLNKEENEKNFLVMLDKINQVCNGELEKIAQKVQTMNVQIWKDLKNRFAIISELIKVHDDVKSKNQSKNQENIKVLKESFIRVSLTIIKQLSATDPTQENYEEIISKMKDLKSLLWLDNFSNGTTSKYEEMVKYFNIALKSMIDFLNEAWRKEDFFEVEKIVVVLLKIKHLVDTHHLHCENGNVMRAETNTSFIIQIEAGFKNVEQLKGRFYADISESITSSKFKNHLETSEHYFKMFNLLNHVNKHVGSSEDNVIKAQLFQHIDAVVNDKIASLSSNKFENTRKVLVELQSLENSADFPQKFKKFEEAKEIAENYLDQVYRNFSKAINVDNFQNAHGTLENYEIATNKLRDFFPHLLERKKRVVENYETKIFAIIPKLKEALASSDYVTTNHLHINLSKEMDIQNEANKFITIHFDCVREDLFNYIDTISLISKNYKKDAFYIESEIRKLCKFVDSLEKIKTLPFSTKPKEILEEFNSELDLLVSRWLERSTKSLDKNQFSPAKNCLFAIDLLITRINKLYLKNSRKLYQTLIDKQQNLNMKQIVNDLLDNKKRNEIDRIFLEISSENHPSPFEDIYISFQSTIISTLKHHYDKIIKKLGGSSDPVGKLERMEEEISSFSSVALKSELTSHLSSVRKLQKSFSVKSEEKIQKFNRILETDPEGLAKFLQKNTINAKALMKILNKKLAQLFSELEKLQNNNEEFVKQVELIGKMYEHSKKDLTDVSNCHCNLVEWVIRNIICRAEDCSGLEQGICPLIMLIRVHSIPFVLHCLTQSTKESLKNIFADFSKKLTLVSADYQQALSTYDFSALIKTLEIAKNFHSLWNQHSSSLQLNVPAELQTALSSIPNYIHCKKELSQFLTNLLAHVQNLWATKDAKALGFIISGIQLNMSQLINYCDKRSLDKASEWICEQYDQLVHDAEEYLNNYDYDHFNTCYSQLATWKKLEKHLSKNAIESIDQKIFSQLNEKHQIFKSTANPTPEVIADHLVDLKEFEDKLPHTKNTVVSKIQEVLKNQKDTQLIMKIGLFLQKEGRLGCEIVADYPQFARIQQEIWKKKTQNQDITFTLQNFVISEEKSVWSKVKNWSGLDTDKKNLEKQYVEFEETFKKLVEDHLITKVQGIKKIVDRTRSLLQNRKKPTSNILLAHIFAVWSIEKTQISIDANTSAADHLNYILQPHSAQVISLLRLLGEKGGINALHPSHLIEILTGEGKSVILGVAAVYLALNNAEVTSISYSEYLSSRDYKDFEAIFQYFGVHSAIKYLPIDKLAEQMINSKGDIRSLVVDALVKSAPQQRKDKMQIDLTQDAAAIKPVKFSQKTKVLLIDEVDVFFGEKFYGKSYYPVATYTHPSIYALFKYIWETRGKTDYQRVQQHKLFVDVMQLFPTTWQEFVIEQVNEMIKDAVRFNEPPYVVHEEQIGYRVHDTVSYCTYYQYKTIFAYFHEFAKGNIKSIASFEQKAGFLISCGSFSYSNLPHKFDTILGVTGTLGLTDVEKKIVDHYGIKRLSYAPSVYGPPRRQFDPATNVCVFPAKAEWFLRISQQISDKINSKRAVIVFFETRMLIDEFLDTQKVQISNYHILDEKTQYKDNVVRRATASGTITFCTRPFGRGVDFVCRDDVTTGNGGVHVLVTFLPSSAPEEIQIQGRTARQGDPGSWEMILLESDLANPFNITAEMIQNNKSGSSLYKLLVQQRDKVMNETIAGLIEQECKAQPLHTKSVAFRKLLTGNGPSVNGKKVTDNKTETLKQLLSLNSLSSSASYHFYFCLDDSGSMNGKPWKQLKEAVVAFITKRLEFLKSTKCVIKDLVTIINYSDSVSVACSGTALNSPDLTAKIAYRKGGGTDFAKALKGCYKEIQNTDPAFVPVLLFMSDGASSNGESEMKTLGRKFDRLKVYTIGFGVDCAAGKLQGMANLVKGKYFFGADGAALKAEFEAICKEINAPLTT